MPLGFLSLLSTPPFKSVMCPGLLCWFFHYLLVEDEFMLRPSGLRFYVSFCNLYPRSPHERGSWEVVTVPAALWGAFGGFLPGAASFHLLTTVSLLSLHSTYLTVFNSLLISPKMQFVVLCLVLLDDFQEAE